MDETWSKVSWDVHTIILTSWAKWELGEPGILRWLQTINLNGLPPSWNVTWRVISTCELDNSSIASLIRIQMQAHFSPWWSRFQYRIYTWINGTWHPALIFSITMREMEGPKWEHRYILGCVTPKLVSKGFCFFLDLEESFRLFLRRNKYSLGIALGLGILLLSV